MAAITPVILSGGAGTRLWPLSRLARPKPLVALDGSSTLLQQTALRVTDARAFAPLLVVTGAEDAEAVTAQLMRVEIVPPEQQQPELPPMEAHKFDPNTGEDEMSVAQMALSPPTQPADRDPNNPATWGKVGRNENCPCGSGKKFKHCHGRFA